MSGRLPRRLLLLSLAPTGSPLAKRREGVAAAATAATAARALRPRPLLPSQRPSLPPPRARARVVWLKESARARAEGGGANVTRASAHARRRAEAAGGGGRGSVTVENRVSGEVSARFWPSGLRVAFPAAKRWAPSVSGSLSAAPSSGGASLPADRPSATVCGPRDERLPLGRWSCARTR